MDIQKYVNDVKSDLIVNGGMNELRASEMIKIYRLVDRIKSNSFILEHDDPKSIAEIIRREGVF